MIFSEMVVFFLLLHSSSYDRSKISRNLETQADKNEKVEYYWWIFYRNDKKLAYSYLKHNYNVIIIYKLNFNYFQILNHNSILNQYYHLLIQKLNLFFLISNYKYNNYKYSDRRSFWLRFSFLSWTIHERSQEKTADLFLKRTSTLNILLWIKTWLNELCFKRTLQ